MNAHQGGPNCCKSIGMFRSRGKQVNIVFLIPCKGLFDSGKLFPLADSVLNMMSAWQSAPLSANLLGSERNFFPLILTILQPFDLFYAVRCPSQGKRNQAMLLFHHLIMKQLSNKTKTQKESNHKRRSEFLF